MHFLPQKKKKIPQNHPRSRTASSLTSHYSSIYCQIPQNHPRSRTDSSLTSHYSSIYCQIPHNHPRSRTASCITSHYSPIYRQIPQNHPRSRTASSVTYHYSPIYGQISSRDSKFLQLMRNHKMPDCVTQQNVVCVSVHFKCKYVLQIIGYTN